LILADTIYFDSATSSSQVWLKNFTHCAISGDEFSQ
jgi:hypothetical protein